MKKLLFALLVILSTPTFSQPQANPDLLPPIYNKIDLVPSAENELVIPSLQAYRYGGQYTVRLTRVIEKGDIFHYEVDVDFDSGEYTVKNFNDLKANAVISEWEKEDGFVEGGNLPEGRYLRELNLYGEETSKDISFATNSCQLSAFATTYDPPAWLIARTAWYWYWSDDTTANQVTLSSQSGVPWSINGSPLYTNWYLLGYALGMSHSPGQSNSIIAGSFDTDYANWDWGFPHLPTYIDHLISLAIWSEGEYQGGLGVYDAYLSSSGENASFLTGSFSGSAACS